MSFDLGEHPVREGRNLFGDGRDGDLNFDGTSTVAGVKPWFGIYYCPANRVLHGKKINVGRYATLIPNGVIHAQDGMEVYGLICFPIWHWLVVKHFFRYLLRPRGNARA